MKNHTPVVRLPSPQEIAVSLDDLDKPIRQYRWLITEVRRRNVATDADFQRRFNHFWRVRKNLEWRTAFYSLFEDSKSRGIDFPTALRELHQRTGTIETSFSSKLVATLDPTKPVIDAFVLKFFELRLPYAYQRDRLGRTIEVYRQVEQGIEQIIRSDAMPVVRRAFASQYPNARLSDAKMVDFVLWQIRPVDDETDSAATPPPTKITVDDAIGELPELLRRVDNGEAFLIVDGTKEVATLAPPWSQGRNPSS